jgi:hypothetical protein
METKEYINSGILELYVYGLLSDTENEEVTTWLIHILKSRMRLSPLKSNCSIVL